MTRLVSFRGNIPEEIPHRIRLNNGLTRTDSNTFTIEELNDAGYIIVEAKPIDEFNYAWTGISWLKIEPNTPEE